MPSSTFEQAFQYYLKNISGMSTYTNRFYWISAPDGTTTPYGTYRIIYGDNLNQIVGTSKQQLATVQIDLWGPNEYTLLAMSNLIINDLEGKSARVDGKPFFWATTRGPRQMRDPDFSNLFHFVIDADVSFER